MGFDDLEFCRQAVAYLKPKLSDDVPAIELPELDMPVLSDLGNGLLISYLVDEGSCFEYVSEGQRAKAGLSEDELKQLARENLDRLEKANEARVVSYEDVFAVLWNGNFEASLLLLDNFWDEDYARLAPNGFVAALPARDVLAFCDANSATGIQQLREIVERADGVAHAITNTLYRRRSKGSAWEPYAN